MFPPQAECESRVSQCSEAAQFGISDSKRCVPLLSSAEAGGTKRKGSSKTTQQASKKPRQKAEPLDEETMVALALSSSMLQHRKEVEQRETQVEAITATPELKWKPDAGTSSSSAFFHQSFLLGRI